MISLRAFLSNPLKIIQEPDPRLRVKSQPLTATNSDLTYLKSVMYSLMKDAGGIGLAAPQIGLNYRAIIISVPQKDNQQIRNKNIRLTRFMVNPVIKEKLGMCAIEEACLSVPDKEVEINRAETILVQYVDELNQPQEETFSGLEAICIQHEIDHLEGILISDYLKA